MSDPKQDSPLEASGADASPPDAPRPEDDGDTPDLEDRVLCPDGACIGVIGPDGRCKVCGKRAPSESLAVSKPGEAQAAAPAAVEDDDEGSEEAPPDLAARRLCSDGACIGVIGPDGRCKVCGKPYTGEPEA